MYIVPQSSYRFFVKQTRIPCHKCKRNLKLRMVVLWDTSWQSIYDFLICTNVCTFAGTEPGPSALQADAMTTPPGQQINQSTFNFLFHTYLPMYM